MSNKIYISVICLLSLIIICSTFYFYTQVNPSLQAMYGNSRKVVTSSGEEKLGCRTHFVESKGGIPKLVAFIPTKETTCPTYFTEKVVTKEDFIKDLQNSKDWGILEYSR